MGRAPIPEQFADASIDVVPHRTLKDCVLRYGKEFWQAASKGLGPLFLGPPALYKSYAAAALARALHERACIHVAWCDIPITLNAMERRRFDKTTDEQIDRWKQVPFLVMDDFGMAKVDSWQYGVMAEIGMSRFDTGRPTCWTGNVEIDGPPTADKVNEALRATAGVQLARRIMERSEGFRVYVRGM